MKYPKEVNELIDAFVKYPGVGNKSAERLAIYSITKQNEEDIDAFINALIGIKSIKRCPICNNIMTDQCVICNDDSRDHDTIMVLEDIKGLFAVEKTNSYNGLYHVLDGVINFSNGIGPDDIFLNSLFTRNAKEIILATNLTVEGEITASYIKEMLKDKDIKVTKIAHGLPVGGDLEYADTLTLTKALEGRR